MAVSIAAHSAPKNREMFAIKKSYSIEVSKISKLLSDSCKIIIIFNRNFIVCAIKFLQVPVNCIK